MTALGVARDLAIALTKKAAPDESTPGRRTAVVSAVNTDGTLNLTWATGDAINSVPALAGRYTVSSVVILLGVEGDYVVLGPVAGDREQLGSAVGYSTFGGVNSISATTTPVYMGNTAVPSFTKYHDDTRLQVRFHMGWYSSASSSFIWGAYVPGVTAVGSDEAARRLTNLGSTHQHISGECMISGVGAGSRSVAMALRTVSSTFTYNYDQFDSFSVAVNEVW